MTIEQDALRADFRALLKAPLLGVPAYSADPLGSRRVGTLLAGAAGGETVRKRFGRVSFLDDHNYWPARFDVH
jgi:hypothetical protein